MLVVMLAVASLLPRISVRIDSPVTDVSGSRRADPSVALVTFQRFFTTLCSHVPGAQALTDAVLFMLHSQIR
jgi:hypothetical protein